MPPTVQRTSSTRTTGLSRADQSLVSEIQDANRRAKLGSFSARFVLEGTRKELNPKEAVAAMRAGLEVTATFVTWKMYRGGHKLSPTEKKVRVKVRGVDARDFKSVEQFEKWFDRQAKAASSDRPSRPRSVHPTKRG